MSSGEEFDDAASVAEVVDACARPLLIATDVDGTIAPIAARPEQARLAPGALDALGKLAARDDVLVAAVSGRSLAELRSQFELPDTLHLAGSHGAEMEVVDPLDEGEAQLLRGITATLEAIAASTPGGRVEHKPVAAALHVRGATPEDALQALAAARGAYAEEPLVHVHQGHQVYEVAVRHHTKALAMARLRARLRPGGVAFFGDDLSDETAFAELGVDEVGVKVGPGRTAARFRLCGPADVVRVLQLLASR